MDKAMIMGVGMTSFSKQLHRSWKEIGREAIQAALNDSNIPAELIEAAYVGNSVGGVITGQDTIRGQVLLRACGIGGIPIYNIENACASSSTALHLAAAGVRSGMYECVLVVGVEKMTHVDRTVTFKAFHGGVDVEEYKEILQLAGTSHSLFMEIYAAEALRYMKEYGITKVQLAKVASKNHCNGSLNPFAQYRKRLSAEEILADRLVVEPFTRYMCAPISDGAAAAVVCSPRFARQWGQCLVEIAASANLSTPFKPENSGVIARTCQKAYEQAGIGPDDIHVFEVHDTSPTAEMLAYEAMGLCPKGEAGRLIDEEVTQLHGKKPVNASGGLIAKGHPIGATGMGQIVELVWQLRGKAGDRQIQGKPTAALAQNAGGHLGEENATCTITILTV